MTDVTGWTINDWLSAYRNQTLTPREALTALRNQLNPHDPCWIAIASDDQLNTQITDIERRAAAGETMPLAGVPFVVKDNIDVAGFATTAACPAFSYTPHEDATAVALLRRAGAVVLAKTNLDQFATGLNGTRSPYGAVPNSFNPAYISGGSSSGSAVTVARGLVPFSLGTDTAGSGRVPAGFNNIIGLKPTKGRFSTKGVVPACRSLDCVSVFALTLDDAATVAGVLQQFDVNDAFSRAAKPATAFAATPRLGIPSITEWYGDSQAEAAWQQHLNDLHKLGAELVELDFTPMQTLARMLYERSFVAERDAATKDFFADHRDDVHPVVRSIIENAKGFTATDAWQDEYRRAQLAREIQQIITGVDALVVPTAPRLPTTEAVLADPVGVNSQLGLWTNFVNLADLSALSLPGAFRADGLPAGITLIADAWQDDALIAFGQQWLQQLQLPLGATQKAFVPATANSKIPAGFFRLAVVGAHLTGMPLNVQLQERHARFVETTHTANNYRLYALPDTVPPKPGLRRVSDAAEFSEGLIVELWDVPIEHIGSFVALIPAPLGIGTLTLRDGREVKGFICEGDALAGAKDITTLGGWRAYIQSLKK
ncbi:allophanate hydrolase [Cellvibrio polysaccharolyticus]|uniref:Allophanate hydrolase n=1 Tax=Cellvibrio polysaccharolyticus TaxID=2082724 RepID=A0A928V496_9GAMM|nr:allophanate hydrolase [Cellvibrio polysaccharolyticus]MBE8718493.1 allophanate hydrolase [Cellvibrio polysaccharolyticus]